MLSKWYYVVDLMALFMHLLTRSLTPLVKIQLQTMTEPYHVLQMALETHRCKSGSLQAYRNVI